MSNTRTSGFHYGWVIVVSCFMIMCFALCLIMNCFGLFIKPVTEDLGMSRQAFSMNSTMISAAMMVVSFFSGKVFSGRVSIKKIMMVATVGLSASYALYSMASTPVVFYAISIAVGIFLALLAQVPCSMLVNNWFREKKGLAMGLVFMGSGVGGIILNPIISALMGSVGWRMTYLVMAGVMFVAVAPCTFFLIRVRPEDKGLEPYGGRAQGGASEVYGMTYAEARRDLRFWLLLLSVMIITGCCASVVQQLASYVSDIGYSYEVSAMVSSCSLGLMAVGKLLTGRMYDKLGVRTSTLICMACVIGGIGILSMAASGVAFIGVFLVLFGVGCALTTVAYPILTTALFGNRDYSSIYGIVNVANSVGTAVGSPIAAAIFDSQGSYVPAWYLAAALLCVDFVVLLVMFRKKPAAEAAH